MAEVKVAEGSVVAGEADWAEEAKEEERVEVATVVGRAAERVGVVMAVEMVVALAACLGGAVLVVVRVEVAMVVGTAGDMVVAKVVVGSGADREAVKVEVARAVASVVAMEGEDWVAVAEAAVVLAEDMAAVTAVVDEGVEMGVEMGVVAMELGAREAGVAVAEREVEGMELVMVVVPGAAEWVAA